MTVHNIPNYTQNERVAARDLNRLVEEVQRGAKITAQYPLMIYDGPAGRAIGFQSSEFWAVICGFEGATGYSIKEVKISPGGDFSVLSGGRRGIAYEANGNVVPLGVVVRMYPGATSGEFVFTNCCQFVTKAVDCTEGASSGTGTSSAGSQISSELSSIISSQNSSNTSQDCGTTPACIPFVTDAQCINNRLVIDKQYMAMIGGTLWVFNTAQGCAAGPCGSSSLISSMSSETSSVTSSGTSSATSSATSSGTSSADQFYCFTNGFGTWCDTLHEGNVTTSRTGGPFSTPSQCVAFCGSGSPPPSSSSGTSSIPPSSMAPSSELPWYGYDNGAGLCGCAQTDPPGSIVCGPYATEADCIAANCPCTSSMAPASLGVA